MKRIYWPWPAHELLAAVFLALLTVGVGTAQAQLGPRRSIDGLPAAMVPRAIYTTDLDADGDLDLLTGLSTDSSGDGELEGLIIWFENTDGRGTFGAPQIITTGSGLPRAVTAADLDGDGDADVLAAFESGEVAWYEHTDGQGTFGERQILIAEALGAASVVTMDLDGDGDLDVLAGLVTDPFRDDVQDQVVWFENTEEPNRFGPPQSVATDVGGAAFVTAADLNGDGALDVLTGLAFGRQVIWYEHTDGQGTFSERHLLNASLASTGPTSVTAADLDGDGDLDVLAASSGALEDPDAGDQVVWFENTDGQASFSGSRPIATETQGARSASAADLDGDGDLDVLLAFWYDGMIAWYENVDGRGGFGAQQVIGADTDGAELTLAADLDGDGDLDVLAASCSLCGSVVVLPPEANQLGWYVNEHIVLAVEDDERPDGYRLFPAYPNPFNPVTHFTYHLATPGPVAIRVYDAQGRFVTTLVDDLQGAGSHDITFEATGLPSGHYFIQLEANGLRQTRTATLVK